MLRTMNTAIVETPNKKGAARSTHAKTAARVGKPKARARNLFEALRSLGPVEIKGR